MAPVARTLRWVPFEHRTHLTHLSPTPAIYSCRPTPRHIRAAFVVFLVSTLPNFTHGQMGHHCPCVSSRRSKKRSRSCTARIPSAQRSVKLPDGLTYLHLSLSPTPTRPTAWPSAVACLPSATEPRSLAGVDPISPPLRQNTRARDSNMALVGGSPWSPGNGSKAPRIVAVTDEVCIPPKRRLAIRWVFNAVLWPREGPQTVTHRTLNIVADIQIGLCVCPQPAPLPLPLLLFLLLPRSKKSWKRRRSSRPKRQSRPSRRRRRRRTKARRSPRPRRRSPRKKRGQPTSRQRLARRRVSRHKTWAATCASRCFVVPSASDHPNPLSLRPAP